MKRTYALKKQEIKRRLREFEKNFKKSNEKIFAELCFCILTPQSKAKLCDKLIKNIEKNKVLYSGCVRRINKHIKDVRFHNNKSRYIVEARRFFTEGKKLRIKNKLKGDPKGIREFLVKNIKGVGYKEASHFLRNIGFKDIAILDRHILKNLKNYGVIKKIPKTISKKNYLEIEEKMKGFAKKTKIPLEELDLLLWAKETGEVFK